MASPDLALTYRARAVRRGQYQGQTAEDYYRCTTRLWNRSRCCQL
jgi:hypothetical protein